MVTPEGVGMSGLVRRLAKDHAEGSVRIAVSTLAEGCDAAALQPDVSLHVGNRGLARGKAEFRRLTEGDDPVAVYLFRIPLPPMQAGKQRRGGGVGLLQATASLDGQAARLTVPASVALDFSLSMMSVAQRMVFFEAADITYANMHPVMGLCERGSARELQERKTLAVIIHASFNDADFRATYAFFCRIVSPLEIYIATSDRRAFAGHDQSSILTMPDIGTGQQGWARFLSHLTTGLQAYYEWTLLVEAGEIVVPDPRSGRSFMEQLGATGQDIVRPIGVGLTRGHAASGEPHRVQGQLCAKLCKPSLSRVNVNYSADLKSCHQKAPLTTDDSGFISLRPGKATTLHPESGGVPLSSPLAAAFISNFNNALQPDEAQQLWLHQAKQPEATPVTIDVGYPTDMNAKVPAET